MILPLLTSLAVVLCSSSAMAAPVKPVVDAGGPIAKPIPADCAYTSSVPFPAVPGFSASPAFAAANQVYSFYLPAADTYDFAGYNETTSFTACLQQCYGYGNPGDCTAVLYAKNVTYTAYGAQNVGLACQFFSTAPGHADLVPVVDGSYADAKAIGIDCPAS